MSAVAHIPVVILHELRNSTMMDINEHYSNRTEVRRELNTLIEDVTKSGDCKLGAELLMCLDEFNGAEFGGDMWWVLYILHSAKGGKVLWYGA